MCICIIHENINLLLNVSPKEIDGLQNDLNDFTSKMVCDKSDEQRIMFYCYNCNENFQRKAIDNIINKDKRIE